MEWDQIFNYHGEYFSHYDPNETMGDERLNCKVFGAVLDTVEPGYKNRQFRSQPANVGANSWMTNFLLNKKPSL